MKLLILLIFVSCGKAPTLKEWAKPKMEKFHKETACKDLSYRNHCFDGEIFASEKCKEEYLACLGGNE